MHYQWAGIVLLAKRPVLSTLGSFTLLHMDGNTKRNKNGFSFIFDLASWAWVKGEIPARSVSGEGLMGVGGCGGEWVCKPI